MKKANRAIILMLFVLTMLCALSLVTANPTKQLLLRTNKNWYVAREPVIITATNIGDEPVDLVDYALPGPCPDWFRILNAAEEEIFPVIHHYEIKTLYPLQTEIWVWDQRDGYTGAFVPAGIYTIETITNLPQEPSISFQIVESVGGVSVPVNKLDLLGPWIGVSLLIVFAMIATAVFVGRKRR